MRLKLIGVQLKWSVVSSFPLSTLTKGNPSLNLCKVIAALRVSFAKYLGKIVRGRNKPTIMKPSMQKEFSACVNTI